MAYISIIPQPGDEPANSQPQILGNFTALATILDPDNGTIKLVKQLGPIALGANSINLHTQDLPGAPIPALAAAPEGGPEIYITRSDGINTFNIPITASSPFTDGYAYLPSGLILKWGRDTATNLADFDTPYISGNDIPEFKAVLNVQLTLLNNIANNATINFLSATSTTTDLHVYLNNPAAVDLDFFYLAIGY